MFNFVKQYNISCVCTYLLILQIYNVNLYSVICFNLMFLLGKPFESPQGKLACYQNNGGSNISKHEIGKLWRNFFPIVHLFRLGGGGGGGLCLRNRREKLCLRNTDGCTWVILLNFPTLFAFAVSRMNFYSLAKQTFSRETLFVFITHAYNYFARKFSHFAKKKHSWNQALIE